MFRPQRQVKGFLTGTGWTLDLASGESATLTFMLTAAASTADGAVVTVGGTRTASNETDTVAGNDNDSGNTVVNRNIDIDIDVDDTLAVVAGSGANNITQVITATNNGPSDATGVVITEALTLPTGVSVSSSTPSKGVFDGTGWTLDLASGESATLTFMLTAAASTADGAVVTVGGTRTASNETDTVAGNDNDSGDTVVNRNIDIDIDVDDTLAVVAGSGANNITQVITATNNGPSDATGVVITEALTLPAGVSVSSSTPSKGAYNDVTGWTLDLASGESATLTFILTAAANTADGAVVTVGGTRTASNETDTVAGNDNDSGNTVVNREVDIELAVMDVPDPVFAGSGSGNLVYTVTATNNGPSDASAVVIDDVQTLPLSGVSFDGGGDHRRHLLGKQLGLRGFGCWRH